MIPAVHFKSWSTVRRLSGWMLAGVAASLASGVAAQPVGEAGDRSTLVRIGEHRLLGPRFAAAAVAEGDYLYVSGGSHADHWVLDSIERVDLRTGVAQAYGRLQRGRLWHRMVAVGRTLYVLGGDAVVLDAQGRKQLRTEASVECIDLETGAVSSGPPLPEPRRSFGCVLVDGKIFVIGGCAQTDAGLGWYGSTLVLDQATGRWTKGAPLPTPREAEAVLVAGARIVVPGGYNGVAALRTVESLDLRTGTWERLPPLVRPASAHAAALLGHRLYLFGHYDDVAQCLVYDLPSRRSEAIAAPFRGVRHAAAVVQRDRLYLVGGRTAESSEGFDSVQVLAARPADGAGSAPAGKRDR